MHNEHPSDNDDLLTVPQVCKKLQVSRHMLYGLINKGELLSVRVGHAVRFRRSAVEDYINRHERRGTAPKSG